MRVIVNGEGAEVRATDLAALLSEMDFPFTQVAIAVNQRVVPRGRWAEHALAAGDRIEIITPRQGG
jgi:sulfur carrier protein